MSKTKYLSPIISKITGAPLFPPLHKFNDKYGGIYNLYENIPQMPMMSAELIDNSRNTLELTSNDIVICNYFKAGTHFMKKILLELLRSNPLNTKYSSIDLGLNIPNIEGVPGIIGINEWNEWFNKTNDGLPRILSTHLPPNLFPVKSLDKNTKLIFITRNPKDVALSMHFMINFIPDLEYKGDLNDTFKLFLDGMMYCGDFWDYNSKWFKYKENVNVVSEAGIDVLFVYFEELVDKPLENVMKIADYIGVDADCQGVVEKSLFENVKREYIEKPGNWTLNDKIGLSPEIFFRKGRKNDWKNYFSQDMSDLYDAKTREKWGDIPQIKYLQEM